MKLLPYLAEQWEVIRAAPGLFTAVIIVVVTLVSLAWRFNIRILNERIKLRDDQLADVQSKLNADSPDDVIDKVDALIAKVEGYSLGQWPPITDQQKAAIRTQLGRITPSSAELIVAPDGRGIGYPLADILRGLGCRHRRGCGMSFSRLGYQPHDEGRPDRLGRGHRQAPEDRAIH